MQQRSAGQLLFKSATVCDDTASTTASTAPESCKRYCSASGPNNCDKGMTTAPICKIAVYATTVSKR